MAPRRIQMRELERLLRTTQGRALLRNTLPSSVVDTLARDYGHVSTATLNRAVAAAQSSRVAAQRSHQAARGGAIGTRHDAIAPRVLAGRVPMAPVGPMGGFTGRSASARLMSTGQASAAGPGPGTAIATGLMAPMGVAIDSAGSIYVSDENADAIYKMNADGSQRATLASGAQGAEYEGLAFAPDGTLYAGTLGHTIYTISPSGTRTPYYTTSSNYTFGVAVDNAGAVYYTDFSAGGVRRVSPDRASDTLVGSNHDQDYYVGSNPAGTTLVIPDQARRSYDLYTPATGQETQATLPAGAPTPYRPEDATMDAAGDVFLSDGNSNDVFEYRPDGTWAVVGSGYVTPMGVALDGHGNLIVAARNNSTVYKVPIPPAPGASATPTSATTSTPPCTTSGGYVDTFDGPLSPAWQTHAPVSGPTFSSSSTPGCETIAVPATTSYNSWSGVDDAPELLRHDQGSSTSNWSATTKVTFSWSGPATAGIHIGQVVRFGDAGATLPRQYYVGPYYIQTGGWRMRVEASGFNGVDGPAIAGPGTYYLKTSYTYGGGACQYTFSYSTDNVTYTPIPESSAATYQNCAPAWVGPMVKTFGALSATAAVTASYDWYDMQPPPTSTTTPTVMATLTPTATATLTPTATVSPTVTDTATDTPAATDTATVAPMPAATDTATVTATAAPATDTPATDTPAAAATDTATNTPTVAAATTTATTMAASPTTGAPGSATATAARTTPTTAAATATTATPASSPPAATPTTNAGGGMTPPVATASPASSACVPYSQFIGGFTLNGCALNGAMTNATLTPPSSFAVRGTIVVPSVALDASGNAVLPLAAPEFVFTYGGRAVTASGATLGASGLSIANAHTTLPAGLGGATLNGAFTVSSSGVAGSLTAANVQIPYAGHTLAARTVALDAAGLHVNDPSLALPPGLGQILRATSIPLTRLQVSDTAVISATAEPLTFIVAGTSIASGPIAVGAESLAMPQAHATLPRAIGGGTLTMPTLALTWDGTASGGTDGPVSFKIADMGLATSEVGFDDNVLTTGPVTATLPVFQDGLVLKGLTYDGASVRVMGGGVNLQLPPIKAGTFTLIASASLMISSEQGKTTYDFAGKGHMFLKGIGEVEVVLELGSVTDEHPSNLQSAELDVQVDKWGIPITGTPLKIVGLSGAIAIGAKYQNGPDGRRTPIPGTAIYTIGLGIDLKTDDEGFTFNGNAKATLATDGNMSLGTDKSKLFKVFKVSGGVCVRISSQNDAVCQAVMPVHGKTIDNSGSTGFYAEISISAASGGASIDGSAYAHIWADGNGPELAAQASIGAKIRQSALITMIPPFDLSARATAEMGKFQDGKSVYKGIKAAVHAGTSVEQDLTQTSFRSEKRAADCNAEYPHSWFKRNACKVAHGLAAFVHVLRVAITTVVKTLVPLHFDETVFLSSDGHLRWKNVGGYSLIDPGLVNRTKPEGLSPLGLAPRFQTGLQRIGQLASPASPAPLVPPASPAPLAPHLSVALARGAVNVAPRAAATVDTSLSISRGQTNAVFILSYKAGAPHLSLTDPNGTIYAPYGTADITTDPRLLDAGDIGAIRIVFPAPKPGKWTAHISNLSGNEQYHFTMLATTPPPTLTVAVPAARTVAMAQPRVVLSGRLSGDASWGSSVSLYYTESAGSRAGTAIATGVPLVGGAWRYTWDASRVPAGIYHVYAVLDDGIGPDVAGFAGGAVRVVQPPHPNGPSWAMVALQGGMYRVAWGAPAATPLLGGYQLYYRSAAMPADQWNGLDLGDTRTLMLAQHPGVPYTFAVAAYDDAGHLGPRVAAHPVAPASLGAPFRLLAGRATARRGQTVAIPLTIQPDGAARGLASDNVSLSAVSSAIGITARTSTATAPLFARRPVTLYVTVGARARAGVYHVRVQAIQPLSDRIVTATATVVVRG